MAKRGECGMGEREHARVYPNDRRSHAGAGGPGCALARDRLRGWALGLELRNVVANYAFEKSRRFAGNQPNSGHGDHSRLSCGAGDTQLGPGGQHPAPSRTRWSKDDPPGGKASNTIAQFALDFPRKQSVCGDHGRQA